jgi:hypothetical protein
MAEIWRVELWNTGPTGEYATTFHLRGDRVGLPDAFLGDAEDVSGAVNTELTAAWRAVLRSTHTFERILVTSVPDPQDLGALPEQHERSIALAGTRVTAQGDLPSQLCGMLKLSTGIPSRNFRGRMFMAPCEDDVQFALDLFDSAGTYAQNIVAFESALDNFLLSTGGVVGTWDATDRLSLIVYSRTRAEANLDPRYAHVTNIGFDRVPHWLRSRGN